MNFLWTYKATEKLGGIDVIALRKKILESGKVKDLVTTEDIFCSQVQQMLLIKTKKLVN